MGFTFFVAVVECIWISESATVYKYFHFFPRCRFMWNWNHINYSRISDETEIYSFLYRNQFKRFSLWTNTLVYFWLNKLSLSISPFHFLVRFDLISLATPLYLTVLSSMDYIFVWITRCDELWDSDRAMWVLMNEI